MEVVHVGPKGLKHNSALRSGEVNIREFLRKQAKAG